MVRASVDGPEVATGRGEEILAAALFAAERFLGTAAPWQRNIYEVLERLGLAAHASRVYIFENYADAQGRQCGRQRYEWVADGISAQIENRTLQGFGYADVGWGRWAEVLGRRETMAGNTRDLPACERPELEAEQIQSIVLVPIYVEDSWWGFIGFDECVAERDWGDHELAALAAAADTLGAAIQRTRIEKRLRAQEAKYRAVFEVTGDGLAIVDLEGRLVEANAAFHAMHGYRPGGLVGKHLDAWVDSTDLAAATELLSAPRQDAPGTRLRHLRGDGSLFPVEVRADSLCIHGETHVVAVVRDVTDRVSVTELLERRVTALAQVAGELVVDEPPEVTLRNAVTTVVHASSAIAAALHVLDRDTGEVRLLVTHGLPQGYEDGLRAAWEMGVDSPAVIALREQRVSVIRDAPARTLANPRAAPIHRFLPHVGWDILVAIPLGTASQTYGALHLYYRPESEPSTEEIGFLSAVADQMAVAVENAALLAESRQTGALLERQRLARELHDSVSQALFSMTLHARTAQLAMERQNLPAEGPLGRAVAQLRELTSGALAEMRALIFELRPGALAEEGLASALRRQAAAIGAREGLPIDVVDRAGARLPLDASAEEHLYRMVLEALHNTLKHAAATRAVTTLDQTDAQVVITVHDDGCGFDTDRDFSGHLGLRTMRERAASIGGELRIDSVSGVGTTVTITAAVQWCSRGGQP